LWEIIIDYMMKLQTFVQFSGKMDILATLRVQKHYFEVSSSALSDIKVFRFVFNKDQTHFYKTQDNNSIVKLTPLDVY